MAKTYEPPEDAAHVFAEYRAHYEGERELKPQMLTFADRELLAGATVGQLAKLTGLTPEVFRRRARTLGVEHKRPPTVGKLRQPTPERPQRPSAPMPQRRTQPHREPSREGRPLLEDEAATLAATARTRATTLQLQKLEHASANAAKGYEAYAIVSTALDMELLTHDEVYATAPERPTADETNDG